MHAKLVFDHMFAIWMYYSMFIIINQPDSKNFFFKCCRVSVTETFKVSKYFCKIKPLKSTLPRLNERSLSYALSPIGDLLSYTLTSTKSLEGLEGKKTSVHKLLEPIYSFNILTLFALSVWNK